MRNFRIAETVLKKCALAGLTIHEIGTMMYRDDPDLPSALEELIQKTEEFCETIVKSVPKELLKELTKTEKKKSLKKAIAKTGGMRNLFYNLLIFP